MNILDMIPGAKWIELGVIASVIALAAGAYGLQHHQVMTLKAQLAAEKQGRDQDRARYSAAAASASMSNQAETARRINDQGEIANESQRFTTRATADRAVRLSAADGLRSATAAIAARCSAAPGDPAASAVGPAASAPGDLLAYVQRRMGQAAAGVVDYADQLRPAAEQCAGDYDALTPGIAIEHLKLGP